MTASDRSAGSHRRGEAASDSLLGRGFYDRDPLEVAPELLNKVLCRVLPGEERLAGRIVEVEAYRGADDPASHAYRGRTARNAAMFGEPGHLYVYFTYGMHFCANVVCRPPAPGSAGAVLLRALAPLEGLEEMRRRRSAGGRRRVRAGEVASGGGPTLAVSQLCSGPAKLCEAFGIDRSLDGADLVPGAVGARRQLDGALVVLDDGVAPPRRPARGPRIGLGASTGEAATWAWRFAVAGDPNVSRPLPGASRRRSGRLERRV